jgi:hypothetical protein
MTTRVIQTEGDRALLLLFLKERPLPYTVDITKGIRRSVEQNRLQRLWLNEISEQLGDQRAEQVRGYCKLRFGVPIMRAENETFMEKYDRIIKPMPYETKLELMMEPMDFPVSRLMTTEQKGRYLDAIWDHYTAVGVRLTDPESQRTANWWK